MPPGVAPPYRQAAAWPSSWKPAEATASANTSSNRPGSWNASAVADATPLWNRTNQNTPTKQARIGHITHGRNRTVNGAVSLLVSVGLVTRTFQRSASSGLRFGGALCSNPASNPCAASFSAMRSTWSGPSRRPSLRESAPASSSRSRSPSTASSSPYMSGPRCTICPSPRRTRAAPSLYPDPWTPPSSSTPFLQAFVPRTEIQSVAQASTLIAGFDGRASGSPRAGR